MQFSSKTVLGLFDASEKKFVIPVYQRAYSWEKEHWQTFLDDLKEQLKGSNNYFFGNLLLETIKQDVEYEVIDGQQRLTTIVLFVTSLLNLIENRKIKLKGGKSENKRKIYLKNAGIIKLRPVQYDRSFFDDVIINRKPNLKPTTTSQKRMIKAIEFFTKEMEKEDDDMLVALFNKLETTGITCVEFDGKKDSALMFELQNNRGKDLTNMEKIKSFFMYQMYTLSTKEETESNIQNLSNLFSQIYLAINDLSTLDEDSVLNYHCQAYINGFSYRNIENIKDAYKKSKSIEWIIRFVSELLNSFQSMKQLEKCKAYYWKKIKRMNEKTPAFVYPFILKAYKFFGDDSAKMNLMFRVLEILSFRYLLISSRADFNSRMNEILNSFEGDIHKLAKTVKAKMNDTYYWGDQRMKEYIESPIYGNQILHYLLWEYEGSIQMKGYSLEGMKLENESIEHISPQTPTNGKPVETGYEINSKGEYSEDYDIFINSIGNLLLISASHNSSIGNKKFKEKLDSYKKNPLLKQQEEVADFVSMKNDRYFWDRNAISRRKEKVLEFSLNNWDFDSVVSDSLEQ